MRCKRSGLTCTIVLVLVSSHWRSVLLVLMVLAIVIPPLASIMLSWPSIVIMIISIAKISIALIVRMVLGSASEMALILLLLYRHDSCVLLNDIRLGRYGISRLLLL